ncbi:hypothetical protein AVEN_166662-1 [Araneus ventricosus]|uniref:Uncharacterized protein n=1 Tax=Araneus ventricosus TaxID=182803 RepID=A0A4Y2JQ66_ARAVE|nr:hypothetical protein AVEN_166662-1 [Araneus ventricosus]
MSLFCRWLHKIDSHAQSYDLAQVLGANGSCSFSPLDHAWFAYYFSRGDKKFNICTKCNMIEATPQHLLDCVALVYDDLHKRPNFVLEVMKANDLMDLI